VVTVTVDDRVHMLCSRGRYSGLTAISAASDARLLPPPVTVATGERRRRPQVRQKKFDAWAVLVTGLPRLAAIR
jgi:hypothetical protein